jgi:hypothetical protein
MFDII